MKEEEEEEKLKKVSALDTSGITGGCKGREILGACNKFRQLQKTPLSSCFDCGKSR